MGIIDTYQEKQKQLQIEYEKREEERKEQLNQESHRKFEEWLDTNATKLKNKIAQNGCFNSFYEIDVLGVGHYQELNKGVIETSYFALYRGVDYDQPNYIGIKDSFTTKKLFFGGAYMEVTSEGQYYVDEICRRFLAQVELGEDEIFSYKPAICYYTTSYGVPNEEYALPCTVRDSNHLGRYKFAIKYSLTKRN